MRRLTASSGGSIGMTRYQDPKRRAGEREDTFDTNEEKIFGDGIIKLSLLIAIPPRGGDE